MANMKINGIEILFESGFAISKNVDAVVNSANNGLLLGMGEAGMVRKSTGRIAPGTSDYEQFYDLCHELKVFDSKVGHNRYIGPSCNYWMYDQVERDAKDKEYPVVYENGIQPPSIVQLECLKRIKTNKGLPFEFGDSVLTSSGNYKEIEGKPKWICHAIGMGYVWNEDEKTMNDYRVSKGKKPVCLPENWPMRELAGGGDRLKASPTTVESAILKSLENVVTVSAKSIAIPVMCARDESYGVTPEESFGAFFNAVEKAKTSVNTIIYCANHPSYVELFKQKGWLQ